MIFYLSAICILLKDRHSGLSNEKNNNHCNLYKTINVIVTVILIITLTSISISFLLHCTECSMKEAFVALSTFIIYFAIRIHVFKCLTKLHLFKRKILRISCGSLKKSNLPYWVFTWSNLIIFLNAFMFMHMIKILFETDMLKAYLYSYMPNDAFPKLIISVAFTYCTIILLYMPLNIFSIFYVMICFEIKELILSFSLLMKRRPRYNYNTLIFTYNEIKSVIFYIDSNIGFLMFISFIFNALTLYLGVSIFINSHVYIPGILMICSFSISFCNYLATTVSASEVHEASLIVKVDSKRLQEDNPHLISTYLRFLQNCEEEISLTVWGILSIKKNVILGTLGTILTYTLLFDSVPLKR